MTPSTRRVITSQRLRSLIHHAQPRPRRVPKPLGGNWRARQTPSKVPRWVCVACSDLCTVGTIVCWPCYARLSKAMHPCLVTQAAIMEWLWARYWDDWKKQQHVLAA